MASITAAQLLIRLNGLAGRVRAIEADTKATPSTVMDPNATDVPLQDELAAQVRAKILQAEWTGEGATVFTAAMQKVDDGDGAKAALVRSHRSDGCFEERYGCIYTDEGEGENRSHL